MVVAGCLSYKIKLKNVRVEAEKIIPLPCFIYQSVVSISFALFLAKD
jgi:hypothetical protein